MVVADEWSGTMRYRLLETMRQYADQRLDTVGDGEVVRNRHAAYYVALAEAAAVGVKGRDEQRWVGIGDAEFTNFTAALDWAIATEDADLALQLANALRARPGVRLAAALARVANMPAARHHPLRPNVLSFGGIPALVQSGNIVLITDRVREMDEAFAEAGLELSVEAHFAHAALGSVTANLAAVHEHGHAATISWRGQAGDRYAEGWCSAVLAMLVVPHGDTESAAQLAEHAHAVGVELGNPTLLGLSDVAGGVRGQRDRPRRGNPTPRQRPRRVAVGRQRDNSLHR